MIACIIPIFEAYVTSPVYTLSNCGTIVCDLLQPDSMNKEWLSSLQYPQELGYEAIHHLALVSVAQVHTVPQH